jgi:hypothetical protein
MRSNAWLINAFCCLHVKHSCHVVSLDDVLLHLDASDHRGYWNPLIVWRPASFGTNGPSKVASSARGTLDRSFVAKQFK